MLLDGTGSCIGIDLYTRLNLYRESVLKQKYGFQAEKAASSPHKQA